MTSAAQRRRPVRRGRRRTPDDEYDRMWSSSLSIHYSTRYTRSGFRSHLDQARQDDKGGAAECRDPLRRATSHDLREGDKQRVTAKIESPTLSAVILRRTHTKKQERGFFFLLSSSLFLLPSRNGPRAEDLLLFYGRPSEGLSRAESPMERR